MPELAHCSICKQFKPQDKFTSGNGKWGLRSSCKECSNARARQKRHERAPLEKWKNPRALSLVGMQFTRLFVLQRLDNDRHGKTIWLCRCDCGAEVKAAGSHLISGSTKSCGCLPSVVRLTEVDATVRKIFCFYRCDARRLNREWRLTVEQVGDLIFRSCYYCGASPSMPVLIRHQKACSSLKRNGIDRVDNSLGYLPNNVVACCGLCNQAKSDLSYAAFIELCRRVVDRHDRAPVEVA